MKFNPIWIPPKKFKFTDMLMAIAMSNRGYFPYIEKIGDKFLEEKLNCYYGGEERHYHNQRHIYLMLEWAHGTLSIAQFLAVIYHDSVYIPGDKTNGQKSVELLKKDLGGKISHVDIKLASEIIMNCDDHIATCEESKKVIDLDLGILASNPNKYQEYAKGVFLEYQPVVGLDAYLTGRQQFLESKLAQKETFYGVSVFNKTEPNVAKNLKKELATIINGSFLDYIE